MPVCQKICLVDDNNAVRHSLRVLLELNDFAVEDYADARDFLERVRPDETSCLITDLYMPEMDGVQLLHALERKGISLPTIVLTGRAESPLAKWALEAGVYGVLSKPVLERVLLDAIRGAMESARASDHPALVAANQHGAGNRLHTIP